MNSSLLSYLTIGNIADYSAKFSAILKDKNTFIICDQNTYSCVKYLKSNIKELSNSLICKVNVGEENKNLETSQRIWNFLLKKKTPSKMVESKKMESNKSIENFKIQRSIFKFSNRSFSKIKL